MKLIKTYVSAFLLAIAAILPFGQAHALSMTDALENSITDWFFRAQAFTPPATIHVALLTTACGETGGGTEVTGGAYARVAVTSSLANWAGTQAAASTAVSSGNTGTTSNNIALTFPAPTANWGTVSHFALMSAASAGTMYFCAALTTPKTINNLDAAPSFAISSLTIQTDN